MLILAFVVCAGFSCGLTYFFLQKKLFLLQSVNANLTKDIETLEKNSEAFEIERQKIVTNEKEKYDAILKEKDKNLDELKKIHEKQISDLKTEYQNALQTQKADYALAINEMKKTASEHFKSVANDILKKESEDLQTQGGKTILNLLSPFKADMDNLGKSVIELLKTGEQNKGVFEQQMKIMSQNNDIMMKTTENLTKALKGDKKLQGNWGEMVIKDILDSAGLIEGKSYISQGRGLQLKSEEGKTEQPDFIINLPDEKHIILDSKVSLVNYEQYISTQDEVYLKEFIKNVQDQVKNLASKKYHESKTLNAPELTIMCIPIEPAYLLAIQKDPTLYSKALEQKIFICGPSNLIPVLHIVGNLWVRDSLNKSAKDIASRARQMFAKFKTFQQSMDSIGKSIESAENTYKKAYGQLIDGKGSLGKQMIEMNDLATKHGIEIDSIEIEETPMLES